MSSFDEREKSFEAKYKRDQETEFRVAARRNKLLGLWAAEQFGLTGAEADAYAREVVQADFDEPGDADVQRKVMADFQARGVDMTDHRLRLHMDELLITAREQILKAG